MSQQDLDRGRPQIGHDVNQLEEAQWWDAVSRAVSVRFPAANTPRDIVHGLGVVPDGYLILRADANVIAVPGRIWTRDLAYLQAGTAGARATLLFVTLREAPRNA